MKRLYTTIPLLLLLSCCGYCGVNVWTQGTGFGNYDVYAIAVDTTTTGRAYASGGGMWRTSDAGSNWLLSGWDPYSSGAASIAIDPIYPNIVWAGVHIEPFRSLDYASTWQVITTNLYPNVSGVWGLEIDTQNRAKMLISSTISGSANTAPFFVSNDTGMTWQSSYSGMTSTGGAALTLVRHPQNQNTFYVAVGGQPAVYVTTDGASTWQSLPTPFGASRSLAIDPVHPNILYVGLYGGGLGDTGGEIWKTIDGGTSWFILTGYPIVNPARGLLINPENTDIVYAATWGAGV